MALAGAACSEPLAGFDTDEDPSLLEEFEGKSDGDPCASWAGGELLGDDLLVLVNKDEGQQLAKSWSPPDAQSIPERRRMPGRPGELRAGALSAALEMFDAASADGLDLRVRSAYRSYRTQCITFNFKVETRGLEHAQRFSAEPGRSQHQLATTIDITSRRLGWGLEQSMGDAQEGQWLAANADVFGYALSYPRDSESITGYAYEPWHYRYIGRAAAAELADSGLLLEQYLAVCADPDAEFAFDCPREE